MGNEEFFRPSLRRPLSSLLADGSVAWEGRAKKPTSLCAARFRHKGLGTGSLRKRIVGADAIHYSHFKDHKHGVYIWLACLERQPTHLQDSAFKFVGRPSFQGVLGQQTTARLA